MDKDRLFDHFAGAALGCFIGDSMGMPVEGWPPEWIHNQFGWLEGLHPGRFPAGMYTDDTQMMIGLLEALVETGGFDPAPTARRFAENYDEKRGYGGRIAGIMHRLSMGDPWHEVGADSFGNGSAMRVAPVGFWFFDDLEKMEQAAATQSSITHRHPEALAGAVTQAGSVALATRYGLQRRPLDAKPFLQTLADLAKRYDRESARRLMGLADLQPGPPPGLAAGIRERYRCDIKSVESVGPAVACLLLTSDFMSAVTLAVNLGGDADTIGAMAGAAAGAYYGLSALPGYIVARLENGPAGRDHILDLCHKAAEIRADSDRGKKMTRPT